MARKRARRVRTAGSEPGGDIAIETHRLTKAYGDLVAVDKLNLAIHAGEVFGLLGPNGAGKTTTILMLLGLSEPTSGRAEVVGFDPTRQPLEVKRRVGYLPDDVGFYAELTGRQNMRYTAALNGIGSREANQRIGELLDQVGLADAADRRVEQYSRGMRQRLGLADALVKDPSVVILDEPTASIDPAGVTEVLALIQSLARENGVTVLLSSHLLHQVHQVCDRVAIFNKGRVLAQGRMAQLAEELASDQLELEVGLDGPADQVEAALRSVAGVTKVTRDPHDPHLWRVAGPQSIRGHLATDLAARGMGVRQLRRVGDELDEIYLRYFQRDEGGRDNAA
ncbi:MAG TPA: ABC transporter ATP-binding protein [Candidatus Limnocylindrales bacterium]|jgi:ABC-2 type transport system ATP-binding protein|nr:ABC transporter ATP-binding protein [Candidatus Limnocylindrales bacterium]